MVTVILPSPFFIGITMKTINILSVLIFAAVGLVFGQLEFSIDTQSGYASNAFANYNMLPDYYTTVNATVNNDWLSDSNGLRWYYRGSLDAFQKYTNRTYQTHTTGINLYQNFDDYGNRVNAGFEMSKRIHSEDYEWYEMAQYDLFVNGKFILADQLYGYLGLNVRWREYSLLDAFSHNQTVLFARISSFFDTGTTMIFEADILTKSYYPANETSNIENLPEIVTVGDGNSQQFVGLIKAAQSLTPTTGLSLQFLLRRNLMSSVRYLGTTTGYYYSDEELFDDVYGYNSEEFSASIKKHLPWKLRLSLGSDLRLKNYDKRLALDLEGNAFADERLRKDDKWAHWLSLSKSLKLANNMSPLSISLNWSFINNKSNDPYYDYQSSYFTIGLSQDF